MQTIDGQTYTRNELTVKRAIRRGWTIVSIATGLSVGNAWRTKADAVRALSEAR